MNQFIALLISLAIEIPCVWWLISLQFRREKSARDRYSISEILTIATCATVLTHPWVWSIDLYLTNYLAFIPRSIVVEIGGIFVEAIVYRVSLELSWRSAFGISGIANLLSFSLGLLLIRLLS